MGQGVTAKTAGAFFGILFSPRSDQQHYKYYKQQEGDHNQIPQQYFFLYSHKALLIFSS
jgi:hypothetical protein